MPVGSLSPPGDPEVFILGLDRVDVVLNVFPAGAATVGAGGELLDRKDAPGDNLELGV